MKGKAVKYILKGLAIAGAIIAAAVVYFVIRMILWGGQKFFLSALF